MKHHRASPASLPMPPAAHPFNHSRWVFAVMPHASYLKLPASVHPPTRAGRFRPPHTAADVTASDSKLAGISPSLQLPGASCLLVPPTRALDRAPPPGWKRSYRITLLSARGICTCAQQQTSHVVQPARRLGLVQDQLPLQGTPDDQVIDRHHANRLQPLQHLRCGRPGKSGGIRHALRHSRR